MFREHIAGAIPRERPKGKTRQKECFRQQDNRIIRRVCTVGLLVAWRFMVNDYVRILSLAQSNGPVLAVAIVLMKNGCKFSLLDKHRLTPSPSTEAIPAREKERERERERPPKEALLKKIIIL